MRALVTDGKGSGFAEQHTKSPRTRVGPDGRAPRAAPATRETVFGRDVGHEWGDDHVTRAFCAMDRGRGVDGGGQRELDREPGGAGGSGRESGHGKAVGPKPKTPDVDLGVEISLPASGRTTPTTPARTAATPACARPAEPGTLAALDPAAAGATMIGQGRRIAKL